MLGSIVGYAESQVDYFNSIDSWKYANTNSSSVSSERPTYRCPFCPYISIYSCAVKKHIKYKHTREKPFACNMCPFRFTEKINLKRHIQSHNGEKPYECQICQKSFSRNESLKKHTISVHGLQNVAN
ncbi:UNVERIFIED_CONTAM: hypothetical protein RMT77_000106 [Armadillidium vulgare]